MFIGKKIKELAEKQKMTATKLASLLGVTRPAVSAIYEKEDVSTSIIKDCARIFGVPVSYFFDEDSEVESAPAKPKRGCGDALLSAVESLAGGPSKEELQEEIERLRKELATTQRQLEINHHYIAMLEKQLADTSTEKGATASA